MTGFEFRSLVMQIEQHPWLEELSLNWCYTSRGSSPTAFGYGDIPGSNPGSKKKQLVWILDFRTNIPRKASNFDVVRVNKNLQSREITRFLFI